MPPPSAGRRSLFCGVLVSALLLSGCAGSGKIPLVCLSGCDSVSLTRKKPPKAPLHQYDALAIGRFSGQYSDRILNILRAKILDEGAIRLTSDVDDPSTNVAIMRGKTTGISFNQTYETVDGKCYTLKGTYKCRQPYTYGNWDMEFTFNVTDENGNELVSESFSESEFESPEGHIRINPGPVFSNLADEIALEIIPYITPHDEKVSVKLFTAEEVPEFAEAVSYADGLYWEQAIELFEAAVERLTATPGEPKYLAMAHYNLGASLGYSDTNHELAIYHLEKANELVPDDRKMDEVENIRQFVADIEALKRFE